MAPKNGWELMDMLQFSEEYIGPLAIRYPRGPAVTSLKEYRAPIEYGRAECIAEERGICLFALGSMVDTACEVRDSLKASGCAVTLVNARFAAPFDKEMLRRMAGSHVLLVTMEENVASGGFGEHVAAFCAEENLEWMVLPIALPNQYVEHGSVSILKHELGIDAENIYRRILAAIEDEDALRGIKKLDSRAERESSIR